MFVTLNQFEHSSTRIKDGTRFWYSMFLDVQAPMFLIDWVAATETGLKRGTVAETSELAVIEWAKGEHAAPIRSLSVLSPGPTGWGMQRAICLWNEYDAILERQILVFTDLFGSVQDLYSGQRESTPVTEPIWRKPTYAHDDLRNRGSWTRDRRRARL